MTRFMLKFHKAVTVQMEANSISIFTNAQGLYGIGGLPAGTYVLKFTKAGLQNKILFYLLLICN